MTVFPCTKCGACCRSIGGIHEMSHLALPDGSCKHLTVDNRCAIYERRPLACRVDVMHQVLAPKLTREQWYALEVLACKELQRLVKIEV